MNINKLMVLQMSLVAVQHNINTALAKVTVSGGAAMQDSRDLYIKYGTLSEDGATYSPPTDPAVVTEFQAAWTEIQSRNVDIEFAPFLLSGLGDSLCGLLHTLIHENTVMEPTASPSLEIGGAVPVGKPELSVVGGTDMGANGDTDPTLEPGAA